MNIDLKKLEGELMTLPATQRARLAHKLIGSLDENFEANFEKEWLAVAKRRDRELSSGKVKGRPADEVLHEAYRRIGCAA